MQQFLKRAVRLLDNRWQHNPNWITEFQALKRAVWQLNGGNTFWKYGIQTFQALKRAVRLSDRYPASVP